MCNKVDRKPVAFDRSFLTDFQGLLTKSKTGGKLLDKLSSHFSVGWSSD